MIVVAQSRPSSFAQGRPSELCRVVLGSRAPESPRPEAFGVKKRPRSAALGRSGSTEDVEDEDLCVRVTVDVPQPPLTAASCSSVKPCNNFSFAENNLLFKQCYSKEQMVYSFGII